MSRFHHLIFHHVQKAFIYLQITISNDTQNVQINNKKLLPSRGNFVQSQGDRGVVGEKKKGKKKDP